MKLSSFYKEIRVIITSLDINFKEKYFRPIPNLTATVKDEKRIRAFYTISRKLAYYNHRKNYEKELIMLGENKNYKPLSRAVFYKAAIKNN